MNERMFQQRELEDLAGFDENTNDSSAPGWRNFLIDYEAEAVGSWWYSFDSDTGT